MLEDRHTVDDADIQRPPSLGYHREGNIVTLRIAHDDFQALMICLGAAATGGNAMWEMALAVANAVNAGRPLSEWVPYPIPK
jgi:hypothetical protein